MMLTKNSCLFLAFALSFGMMNAQAIKVDTTYKYIEIQVQQNPLSNNLQLTCKVCNPEIEKPIRKIESLSQLIDEMEKNKYDYYNTFVIGTGTYQATRILFKRQRAIAASK